MNEKEALKKLIDSPKQPNVSEWVYEVETFLEEINESNEEAWMLIDGIKSKEMFSNGAKIQWHYYDNFTRKNMIKCSSHQSRKEIKYLLQ